MAELKRQHEASVAKYAAKTDEQTAVITGLQSQKTKLFQLLKQRQTGTPRDGGSGTPRTPSGSPTKTKAEEEVLPPASPRQAVGASARDLRYRTAST